MKLFLLRKKKDSLGLWSRAFLKADSILTIAQTEEEARQNAARVAGDEARSILIGNEPFFVNPWCDPEITSCEIVNLEQPFTLASYYL